MERQVRAGTAELALRAAVRAYQLLVSPAAAALLPFSAELLGIRRRSDRTARCLAGCLSSRCAGWLAAILGVAAAMIPFRSRRLDAA